MNRGFGEQRSKHLAARGPGLGQVNGATILHETAHRPSRNQSIVGRPPVSRIIAHSSTPKPSLERDSLQGFVGLELLLEAGKLLVGDRRDCRLGVFGRLDLFGSFAEGSERRPGPSGTSAPRLRRPSALRSGGNPNLGLRLRSGLRQGCDLLANGVFLVENAKVVIANADVERRVRSMKGRLDQLRGALGSDTIWPGPVVNYLPRRDEADRLADSMSWPAVASTTMPGAWTVNLASSRTIRRTRSSSLGCGADLEGLGSLSKRTPGTVRNSRLKVFSLSALRGWSCSALSGESAQTNSSHTVFSFCSLFGLHDGFEFVEGKLRIVDHSSPEVTTFPSSA